MTDHDRIDLSALDPENDPERMERIVRGVLHGLGPAIVPESRPIHHAVRANLSGRLGRFAVAAAVAAAAAAVSLTPDPIDERPTSIGSPGQDLSWPEGTEWLVTGQPPRSEDLLLLLSQSQS